MAKIGDLVGPCRRRTCEVRWRSWPWSLGYQLKDVANNQDKRVEVGSVRLEREPSLWPWQADLGSGGQVALDEADMSCPRRKAVVGVVAADVDAVQRWRQTTDEHCTGWRLVNNGRGSEIRQNERWVVD